MCSPRSRVVRGSSPGRAPWTPLIAVWCSGARCRTARISGPVPCAVPAWHRPHSAVCPVCRARRGPCLWCRGHAGDVSAGPMATSVARWHSLCDYPKKPDVSGTVLGACVTAYAMRLYPSPIQGVYIGFDQLRPPVASSNLEGAATCC